MEEQPNHPLLPCRNCRAARYCTTECRDAHWETKHQHTCVPYAPVSPEQQMRQLLQTAVLREEQVIARNAPCKLVTLCSWFASL